MQSTSFKAYSPDSDDGGFVPDYDQSELGESQLRMSGKSLIISLLEQRSPRIKLNVFKEARAEIWKIFRLVYVDGQLMPYAVCIQCMKPVAYSKKTTGSLHKHACASAINKLWSKSLGRKRKASSDLLGSSFTFDDSQLNPTSLGLSFGQNQSLNALGSFDAIGCPTMMTQPTGSQLNGLKGEYLNSSMQSINQAINGIKAMSSLSNLQKLTNPDMKDTSGGSDEASTSHSDVHSDTTLHLLSSMSSHPSAVGQLEALRNQLTQNVTTGAVVNPLVVAAAVAAATSAAALSDPNKFGACEPTTPEASEKHSNLFDLIVRCLLPLDQFTLDTLNTSLRTRASLLQMQIMLRSSYSLAVDQVKRSLSQALNLYFVLDFWSGPTMTERFLSIWAIYHNRSNRSKQCRQLLCTRRLNFRWKADQLQSLVDSLLAKFVDSAQHKLYLLENCPAELRAVMIPKQEADWRQQDTWIECSAHQLQHLFDSIVNHDVAHPLMQTLNDLGLLVSFEQPLPDEHWIRLLVSSDWRQDWRLFQRLLRVLVDEWAEVCRFVELRSSDQVLSIAFEDLQTIAVFFDKIKHEFDVSSRSSGVFGVIRLRKQIQRLADDLLSGHSATLQKLHRTISERLRNEMMLQHLQQPLHVAAHCLRPDSKQMGSFTNEQRVLAQQWLNRQLRYVADLPASGSDSSTSEGDEDSSDMNSKSSEECIKKESVDSLDELQVYLDTDFSQESIRDQRFWTESRRSHRFPTLRKVAATLAAIDCTPHCCCITNRGADFVAKRLGLSVNHENFDQLLFLHSYFVFGEGCK